MYYIRGSEIICARCISKDIDLAELAAYLDNYVNELPPAMRVDDSEYVRRLNACAQCEFLLNYTCIKCGCYAQVRAAKRSNRCPIAGHEKW